MIASPYVRTAHASGKLSLALWDHWVPGANAVSTKIIEEWAAKEKVDVQIDYMSQQGNKLQMTEQAEAIAKTGHDVFTFIGWGPGHHTGLLEPVDDIMAEFVNQHGAVDPVVDYLGKQGSTWVSVPATRGSAAKGPCTRMDLVRQHAGIDVKAMYPAGALPKAEEWTLDTFLKAAEACHKAGVPFGIGLGTTYDSIDSVGAFFHDFGAHLVNAKGEITVKTDAVRQAVDYCARLARFLPPDAPSYDDASNNKILLAGRSALILNAPSAWAVAKRDAPQMAEQLWTHGMPKGPKGRYATSLPHLLGIWSFSKNKSAAKSFLRHMAQASVVEALVTASQGFDIPSFAKLTMQKYWDEAGPPLGTLYHYPLRGDALPGLAGAPAPVRIAQQIYFQGVMPKMVVRHFQGEPIEKTLAWAQTEVEGFMRQ